MGTSSVTAWDARTFARGWGIALATLGIAFVVTAASDEGGISWGERAGRALPIAPVCAAVGAWLALAPGRARGEDVALAALGRSPWERHAAAIAGGAAVAALAAFVIAAVPRVDVRGFYPRAEEAIVWRPAADGFASDDGRWQVSIAGVPARSQATATLDSPRSLPRGARAAAALATAVAGLALPMLAAGVRSRRRAALALAAVAATALLTVLAFQAAAAARAPALLAPVAPLLLLAAVATGYRSLPWRKARYPR